MSRWAVVVVDENGEVTVIGAYRWRWTADLVGRATKKAIEHGMAHELLGQRFVIDVEHAGPREFARAYGLGKRALRP